MIEDWAWWGGGGGVTHIHKTQEIINPQLLPLQKDRAGCQRWSTWLDLREAWGSEASGYNCRRRITCCSNSFLLFTVYQVQGGYPGTIQKTGDLSIDREPVTQDKHSAVTWVRKFYSLSSKSWASHLEWETIRGKLCDSLTPQCYPNHGHHSLLKTTAKVLCSTFPL